MFDGSFQICSEGVVPDNDYTLYRQTVSKGPLARALDMVRVNCSNCENFLGYQIVSIIICNI